MSERGGVYQTTVRLRTCLRIAVLLLVTFGVGAVDSPRVTAVALFKGMAVLRIDGRDHTLREGASAPGGVRLLSATAQAARIAIDDEEFELGLDDSISGRFANVPAPPVVRLLPGAQGHYFVDGQINGHPLRFLVDTGASSIVLNKHDARSIGVAYRVDGRRGAVETASGRAAAFAVTFDEVKVQAITLRGVSGVVLDGDSPRQPLLGQSFLNGVDIHREGTVLELHARRAMP